MVATARIKRQHCKELYAILWLALGVFLALCLISYDPADPALNVATNMAGVTNLGGPVGAYCADLLFMIFGISAYVLAGLCFLTSTMLFLGRQVHLDWRQFVAALVMIFATAAMLHIRFGVIMFRAQPIEAGGVVGGLIGTGATRYLNTAGAYVVAGTLLFLSFLYATKLSVALILRYTSAMSVNLARFFWQWTIIYSGRLHRMFPKIVRALAQRWSDWQDARAERAAAAIESAPIAVNRPAPRVVVVSDDRRPTTDDQDQTDHDDEDTDHETADADKSDVTGDRRPATGDGISGPKIYARADVKERRRKAAQLELTRISGHYIFPSLGLLEVEQQKAEPIDEGSLRQHAKTLEQKLLEYDIEGRVSEIHPGPVITMYEFEPAAGVKVNKIVSAANDLSVTMGGRSTRVVAHLPGKAAVGIEIPNTVRETVWLKEIIGDQKFRRANTMLPLALGKNTEGHPVIADLTKMPHLLVAGATGAGKSVAINAMICSILYKATPADVRMILVDPKMLELSIYDGIPHLLLPVVTKPKEAELALKWAVREMERRYRHLSNAGVRNILGYNEAIEKGQLTCVSEEQAETLTIQNPEAVCHTGKLPYLVIVIDEMADLMMVAGREIEESVCRLAQMARAAGIHLILATQRPSVDVITGLIKANFPSRISFKVSSKHDSRTIIDGVGAEHLLGQGDMLFLAPNSSHLLRLHGAFVNEHEIQRIVSHVKQQAEAVYDESILEPVVAEGASDIMSEEYDELYDQAVRIVTETGQASISMVQRRLRIGYNRSARMIERMEAEGVVGPADGSKPRQILVQGH